MKQPDKATGKKDQRTERIGIDTGGTFTDFAWIDDSGNLQIYKEISTPGDPSKAVLAGIKKNSVTTMTDIIHGSTVATNALLERNGARTALITTKGFADVLAIGRQDRPQLYALVPEKPKPLVPKLWRLEVNERVSAEGRILNPLDLTELEFIYHQIVEMKIESVAVCLLFSFLKPVHERQISKVFRQLEKQNQVDLNEDGPGKLHISLSCEILPEFREYERTSTTVINAYVAPTMERYLRRLSRNVSPRKLSVMQSNGGIINPATAGAQAARTVLSGPAGGVVGARYVAELSGFKDLITFDMGGTSTDVTLCPGYLPMTSEGEISKMPLRLPMIDIHTVGAGGGSLAYVDPGGALKVGPASAGADPGPACYSQDDLNQNGESLQNLSKDYSARTTTTDANLVLGRLDATHFLGGGMRLNQVAARDVMTWLASEIGVNTPEEAAWGVIQVANANMARAIRRISVERGFDPRRFTLVAFGGAGPLHACELAESLQIPRVLIPGVPGVLSALGILVADPIRDYSLTVMRQLDSDEQTWLEARFEQLERLAMADMESGGYQSKAIMLSRQLDMRYVGQSHELSINLPDDLDLNSVVNLFHQAHERRYSYRQPEAPMEIVNLRVSSRVRLPSITIRWQPDGIGEQENTNSDTEMKMWKQVWFEDQVIPCRLYERANLKPGDRFGHPALIFQYDTTTMIPPGWRVEVDLNGNLILTFDKIS